jgi:hypothetical protein
MLGPSADRQVFLQISVNGMVKPTVVIDLMPQEAPIVIISFFKIICSFYLKNFICILDVFGFHEVYPRYGSFKL